MQRARGKLCPARRWACPEKSGLESTGWERCPAGWPWRPTQECGRSGAHPGFFCGPESCLMLPGVGGTRGALPLKGDSGCLKKGQEGTHAHLPRCVRCGGARSLPAGQAPVAPCSGLSPPPLRLPALPTTSAWRWLCVRAFLVLRFRPAHGKPFSSLRCTPRRCCSLGRARRRVARGTDYKGDRRALVPLSSARPSLSTPLCPRPANRPRVSRHPGDPVRTRVGRLVTLF